MSLLHALAGAAQLITQPLATPAGGTVPQILACIGMTAQQNGRTVLQIFLEVKRVAEELGLPWVTAAMDPNAAAKRKL